MEMDPKQELQIERMRLMLEAEAKVVSTRVCELEERLQPVLIDAPPDEEGKVNEVENLVPLGCQLQAIHALLNDASCKMFYILNNLQI